MSANDGSALIQDDGKGEAISIHASAVIVGETGIIIRGASGGGKSSLALALIDAAHQRAWFGCLVGDDRIALRRQNGRLIVSSHPLVRGMIERRGQGILQIAHETAAVARLVVDLLPAKDAPRYPPDVKDCVILCDVELPVLILPETTGPYDSALIILAAMRKNETI